MAGGTKASQLPYLLLLMVILSALIPTARPSPSSAACHDHATPALDHLLTKEDFAYDVKVLPPNKQVSTYLRAGEGKRVVFPLPSPSPLTIAVTPCAAPISWTLSLRPSPLPSITGEGGEEGEEREEESYKGMESKLIERERANPGLYVLQMQANQGGTHVHVLAECGFSPAPPTSTLTATPTPHTRGTTLTLSWSTSGNGGYCLAATEGQPFLSLCAARAAHLPSAGKGSDKQMVLGCTSEPNYQLPHTSRRPLHVSVWAVGRPGPPLVTGVVRPRSRHRMPRLRPGKLVRLVPSATGIARARYRVKRRSRHLHVVVVACGGGRLRLRVTAMGGKRVATVAGSLRALYLAMKDSPPRTMLLQVRTTPPGAATHILLTAAHTARALPLPRPPRKARVRVRGVTCHNATIKWNAAPGPYRYCLVLQQDPVAVSRRTQPPQQCVWESVLRQSAPPGTRWCSGPIDGGHKWYKLTTLKPASHYTATVLARHPSTHRTLSLTPASFSTPPCPTT